MVCGGYRSRFSYRAGTSKASDAVTPVAGGGDGLLPGKGASISWLALNFPGNGYPVAITALDYTLSGFSRLP